MSIYECVVYDKEKKKKKIKLYVNSKKDVDDYINNNELSVVSMKMIKKKKKTKIKDIEMKILCSKMAILLTSGCEITKIIDMLKDKSNKKISYVLDQISNNIKNGNSITESFAESQLFSNFFISMLKSGEISGNLDKAMNNLSSYYEKNIKIKSKVKSVSIYPTILIVISLFAMIFAITVTVPNFEIVFVSSGIKPPLVTKIVIDISTFIRTKYMYILAFILINIFTLMYFVRKNPKMTQISNSLMFKIPIIKDISNLIITTRFCRALSMLVQSGVQIVEGIEIASKTINNKFIYEKLLISKEYLNRGNSISDSLQLANVFPSLFISMIDIGEKSGRIEESLDMIDKFYSMELESKTDEIIKLIEPVTIVIVGFFIGIFIIALAMPMFDAVISI